MRSYWNLKSNSVFLSGLLLLAHGTLAQYNLQSKDSLAPVKKKAETYLFPIQPGVPAILSGTMGELRNNHFHAGLDIDTYDIGENVYSANDGYISRVLANPFGYGNALYVTHPDGNTTLYGHLEKFEGAVGEYVRRQRYQRKVNDIDLFFSPGQFPVKKGDIIAISGNTGGSGGPHLHFEVRNKNNEAINPLLYSFSEVKDNVAPLVYKIAIKTLDISSRVNDQFGRLEFSMTRNGNSFTFPQPILASGRLGIEVLADDKMATTRFKYGINYIEMLVDNELVFTQTIDKIDFEETRRILTLMDFKTLEMTGTRFNKLYIDDGNSLNYYKPATRRKSIEVKDKERDVLIRLKDFNGNESTVSFKLKPTPVAPNTPFLPVTTRVSEVDVQENTMRVTIKQCVKADSAITVWSKGKSEKFNPSYSGKNQNVYLLNLKTLLPDSIQTCQETLKLNIKDRIPSETNYKYYGDWVEINFPNQALYDTAYLALSHDTTAHLETFRIGNHTIPLHRNVQVTLKPSFSYPSSKDLGVYRKEGRGYSFVNSEWQNGKARFGTREFGEYVFLRDTIPPGIARISITNTSARLKIRDNLSGIAYYEATINGQWLLMIYDYKTGIVKSERPDDKKLLKGDFELKVVDNAGNESIFKHKIL